MTNKVIRKDNYINFRVSNSEKKEWKKYCIDKDMTLSAMLTAAAHHYINEHRVLDNERMA